MLPTYYRHSDGAPVTSTVKGVRRSREKFILLMIFIAFVFVCFGAFYYVPDLKESYTKLLDGQDNNHQHQLAIPPPNANKKSARFPPLESNKKEDGVHQRYQEVEKEQTNDDVKGNSEKKDITPEKKVQNKESADIKKKRDFIKKVYTYVVISRLSLKKLLFFVNYLQVNNMHNKV